MDHRNGYRERSLDTRLGSLQLRIPKLRQGSYFPPSVRHSFAGAYIMVYTDALRSQSEAQLHARIDAPECHRIAVLPRAIMPATVCLSSVINSLPCAAQYVFLSGRVSCCAGASFPFPLAPAEVGYLNGDRPFSLGGGNGSKCRVAQRSRTSGRSQIRT